MPFQPNEERGERMYSLAKVESGRWGDFNMARWGKEPVWLGPDNR